MKQFLETGRIVGTHGVRGELKIEPWADSPAFITKVGKLYWDEGRQPIEVKNLRLHKSFVLLTIHGVDTVEKADLLRGKIVYLNRNDVKLPAGQVFIDDLIGLTAQDGKTGKIYGKLTKVYPTGANDVYEIENEAGQKYLFPAVKHMIKEINLANGIIELLPIPGIFDDEVVTDEN
ncbi:ribosome maturation factor RimM [Scatolibacter rhodanostii]|uniref:ribosome maturation factor RimM n=1 Tax=Scatolibacter rhodanostii TaxID=2014781 RepID=UPI001FA8AB8B|nr:ribosome maturation factor RimM [Scatolibacter rhodanostii]